MSGSHHAGDWPAHLRKAKVYEQILIDIVLGELAPGMRLDESALVQRYGAGLAGVRDALGRLALEGLVVRRTRVGTLVSGLDLHEIHQTFVVRQALEGKAAALAASNADQSQINAVSTAFDGAETAIAHRDFRALVGMDQAFHKAVAHASGNRVLAAKLASLQAIAARYWMFSLDGLSQADTLVDVANHRAVVCAIARRDPDAAEAAMLKTIGPPDGAALSKRSRIVA